MFTLAFVLPITRATSGIRCANMLRWYLFTPHMRNEHAVIVCVCVLSHWVLATLGEGPDLPALKCSSHRSLGLYLTSVKMPRYCLFVCFCSLTDLNLPNTHRTTPGTTKTSLDLSVRRSMRRTEALCLLLSPTRSSENSRLRSCPNSCRRYGASWMLTLRSNCRHLAKRSCCRRFMRCVCVCVCVCVCACVRACACVLLVVCDAQPHAISECLYVRHCRLTLSTWFTCICDTLFCTLCLTYTVPHPNVNCATPCVSRCACHD
jgi:hypothetical protein